MADAEEKKSETTEAGFDFGMPSFELKDEIARSVDIIKAFTAKEEVAGLDANEDQMIPLALMQNAKVWSS